MSTSVAASSVPVSASATAADTIMADAEIPSSQPPLSWCQAALSEPLSASPLTVHAVPETPSGLDLVASHAFSVAALHSVTEQLNVAEQLLASERLINRANMYAFGNGYDWGQVASGVSSQPTSTEIPLDINYRNHFAFVATK
jgi:hypothetical protein